MSFVSQLDNIIYKIFNAMLSSNDAQILNQFLRILKFYMNTHVSKNI